MFNYLNYALSPISRLEECFGAKEKLIKSFDAKDFNGSHIGLVFDITSFLIENEHIVNLYLEFLTSSPAKTDNTILLELLIFFSKYSPEVKQIT